MLLYTKMGQVPSHLLGLNKVQKLLLWSHKKSKHEAHDLAQIYLHFTILVTF